MTFVQPPFIKAMDIVSQADNTDELSKSRSNAIYESQRWLDPRPKYVFWRRSGLDLHHAGKSSGDGTVEAFALVTDESSDRYISLSKSWQTGDMSDLKKFLIWLKQHSSFNQSKKLISLFSGIVADDRVNCDSSEELGENAAKGIVGKRFADVTLKRKVQVFTLAAIENTKLIDTDPVVFNPNQLFHRIACVLEVRTTLTAVYNMNGHLTFILYSTTLLFALVEDDFNERY
ncbi:hypothetical protein AVEN_220258-1 [Araneus ventricosus]|uniref:Uncharacterized protein n=1 Tax=Araneus ventricosus TaxID=182803 RepID=A0A4Y2N4S8_ARAVE|nr:hypothetical protein AVEN_220258-1 [Araneus ventricosus]